MTKIAREGASSADGLEKKPGNGSSPYIELKAVNFKEHIMSEQNGSHRDFFR